MWFLLCASAISVVRKDLDHVVVRSSLMPAVTNSSLVEAGVGICREDRSVRAPYVFLCDKWLRPVREAFKLGEFEEGNEKGTLEDFLKQYGDKLKFSAGKQGTGKSKATFFFFGQYIVKTLKKQELELLESGSPPLVQSFSDYVVSNRARSERTWGTTLTRFLAIIEDEHENLWLLQNNVLFDQVRGKRSKFTQHFDVKGSTVGRKATSEEASDGWLKDAAWKKFEKGFAVPPDSAQKLITQLNEDSDFLEGYSLIDYSLLVGVRKYELDQCQDGKCRIPYCFRNDRRTCVDLADHPFLYQVGDRSCKPSGSEPVSETVKEQDHCMVSLEEKETRRGHPPKFTLMYTCLGTIDMLTEYTSLKKGEYAIKGGWLRSLSTKYDTSVQPPSTYRDRFQGAMHATISDGPPKGIRWTTFEIPEEKCCQFPSNSTFARDPKCKFELPAAWAVEDAEHAQRASARAWTTRSIALYVLGGLCVLTVVVFLGRELRHWWGI